MSARDALIDALITRIEDLARTLLGEPNRLLSNKTSWRYGRNGSLVLELAGNRRGLWFSHEDGEGGSVIELIMREQALDVAGAFRWAHAWLGGSFSLPAGDSRSRKLAERPAPSSANDNRAKASETRPEPKEDPAAYARRIWTASVPIAGTLGETYWPRPNIRVLRGQVGPERRSLRSNCSLQ
jgi:hypothetical protein